MRTDVLDIEQFYDSALGQAALGFLRGRLEEAWGDGKGQRIAGFGHTDPYLALFHDAERKITLVPEGMGAVQPEGTSCIACLTADTHWPLPDASMDRILVVHGLEEAASPKRLLREIWRVLTDEGKAIIVVPNRRGPWAMVDSTPFSAGRPYLKGQLDRFLKSSMFTPLAWSSALYFPPLDKRFLLRASKAWEQAGAQLWSAFAGVLMVEVCKEIAVPVSGSKAEILPARVLRPAATRVSLQSRREPDDGD